ncbi:MAG: TetR/AcrR family transcriptional regulator [Halopseudomonas sp.]
MATAAPRRRAQQMAPEQRKRQLLELAVRAFAEKGVDAAKHADVAKAAKVSVPTVFTYFPSRQALVAEVLAFVGDYMLEHVLQPSMVPETQRERLYLSAKIWVDAVEQHPDYIKVWLMWSNHFAPDIQRLYLAFESRLIAQLTALIYSDQAADQDPLEMQDRARMLLGAATMLAQLGFRGEQRTRQEAYVQHVIDNFKV